MLGLLIKDLQYMKKQWSILLFVVFMGVIMFASSGQYSNMFVTYCTMFGGLMVLNTISYDSFDNGYAYLFTLPVTPGLYVAEKYLFVLLVSFAGCAFSGGMVALMTGRGGLELWEHLIVCLTIWGVLLWVTCVMLPLNLKFGTEKSRSILMAVWVALVTIVVSASIHISDGGKMKIHGLLSQVGESLGEVGIFLVLGISTVAVFLLSMAISTRIMQKKEY